MKKTIEDLTLNYEDACALVDVLAEMVEALGDARDAFTDGRIWYGSHAKRLSVDKIDEVLWGVIEAACNFCKNYEVDDLFTDEALKDIYDVHNVSYDRTTAISQAVKLDIYDFDAIAKELEKLYNHIKELEQVQAEAVALAEMLELEEEA